MPKTPKACKVCERLTKKAGEPTKCKRHGGKVAKPTGGGRRSKKSKPAKAHAFMHNATTDNGHPGSIAARIRGLVQAVAAGKSAQVELDAIRKVMAGA